MKTADLSVGEKDTPMGTIGPGNEAYSAEGDLLYCIIPFVSQNSIIILLNGGRMCIYM